MDQDVFSTAEPPRDRGVRQGPRARFAIGVGARRGVDALELVSFVRETAKTAGARLEDCALFAVRGKQDEPGLHEAARLLATPLVFLPLAALCARKTDVLTRSARVEALTGVGSVAEAAALAGAGDASRLIQPRVATARLTCAIAIARERSSEHP